MLSRLFFIFCLLLIMWGCASDDVSNTNKEINELNHGSQERVADPSVEKCEADGYTIEPVIGNIGVAVSYMCVSENNNKKCDSWSYYRGECSL